MFVDISFLANLFKRRWVWIASIGTKTNIEGGPYIIQLFGRIVRNRGPYRPAVVRIVRGPFRLAIVGSTLRRSSHRHMTMMTPWGSWAWLDIRTAGHWLTAGGQSQGKERKQRSLGVPHRGLPCTI